MATSQTILFLGATGGCGLGALRRSIAAGHTCIAICRTPSRLTERLPASQRYAANLRIVEGNAHDQTVVAKCLVQPADPSRLVDAVVFSIGAAFSGLKLEDPNVCGNGIKSLLAALGDVRKAAGATGRPRIVAVSTTGVSAHGRDIPLTVWPLYHFLLKTPHADKMILEETLIKSGEEFVIVRPSLLKDGSGAKDEKKRAIIRVGIEDPRAGTLESRELGCVITRDDVGRWIFEEALSDDSGRWVGKIASITH